MSEIVLETAESGRARGDAGAGTPRRTPHAEAGGGRCERTTVYGTQEPGRHTDVRPRESRAPERRGGRRALLPV